MTTNVARTVHGSGILCLAKFAWTTLKTGQFHYFQGSLSVVMATMLIIFVVLIKWHGAIRWISRSVTQLAQYLMKLGFAHEKSDV